MLLQRTKLIFQIDFYTLVLFFTFLYILNVAECAKVKKSRGTIVNGLISGAHEFPYAAYLGVDCVDRSGKDREDGWVCTSSIINQKTLLTAGHCIICPPETNIKILAKVGHANKNRGISRFSDKVKLHEDYDEAELYNDIGIIILDTDLEFGLSVKRVILLKSPPVTDMAIVSGWGLSKENNHHTEDVLRNINQTIVTDKHCLSVLYSRPKGTVCATNLQQLGHAAMGDSGGALVVRDNIQVGIVSYRVPAIKLSLTVYTAVGYFIGWIRHAIRSIVCANKYKKRV